MKKKLALATTLALTALSSLAYADGKGAALYEAAEKTTICSEKFFGHVEYDEPSKKILYCKPKAFNEYVKQVLSRTKNDKKLYDRTIKIIQKAFEKYGTWHGADWDLNKKQTEFFLNNIEFIIRIEFDANSKAPLLDPELLVSFISDKSNEVYYLSSAIGIDDEICGKKNAKYCSSMLNSQIQKTIYESILQNIDKFSSVSFPKNLSEEMDIILSYLIPTIASSEGRTEAPIDFKTGKFLIDDEPPKKPAKKKHK